jgi:hypothetical protein
LDGEPNMASEVARLDEAISALKTESKAFAGATDYADLISRLDDLIPEDQRSDAPANASEIDRVFHKITTALSAAKRPVVPATDAKRPDLQTPIQDFSTLPAHARMARGYAA